MSRPIITLLTDFGTSDHYAGVMKGVMLGICPDAVLVDISHDIPAYGIRTAAFAIAQCSRYFPPGTVHLVVIDPGVGSMRRAILVEAGRHYFVAPDNGVLTKIISSDPQSRIYEIRDERFWRQPVSRTFHGRDIFSPVAAHVANGIPPERFGPRIDDPILAGDDAPRATGPSEWLGHVQTIDRFGNVVTDFLSDDFAWIARQSFELTAGEKVVRLYFPNYAASDAPGVFVIQGSSGFLELSMNRGDAAKELDIAPGAFLRLRRV